MPATNAPTTNYWTRARGLDAQPTATPVLNVSGGKGTTISNPVAYTGCGTTGNYGAYYGIAPDNGSAKHALWPTSTTVVLRMWTSAETPTLVSLNSWKAHAPQATERPRLGIAAHRRYPCFRYVGYRGSELRLFSDTKRNRPNSERNPDFKFGGSFAILCPGCTVGQTGTFHTLRHSLSTDCD